MHTVLLDRAGYIIQKWNDTHISSLDPRAYPGTLMMVEGDVAPGHQFKDGRFWMVPPRVTSDEILAECDRRLGIFPPALQEQLAAIGGQFTVTMFNYVRDVQMRASQFLAADSAPADYRDDGHWPRIPDLSATPPGIAVVPPQPVSVAALPPSAPVEVRIILEGAQTATQTIPARVVEHLPAVMDTRTPTPQTQRSMPDQPVWESSVPVQAVDSEEDIERAKEAFIRAVEATYDAHKDSMPDDRRDALVALAIDATASRSVREFQAAERRAIEIIEGHA